MLSVLFPKNVLKHFMPPLMCSLLVLRNCSEHCMLCPLECLIYLQITDLSQMLVSHIEHERVKMKPRLPGGRLSTSGHWQWLN